MPSTAGRCHVEGSYPWYVHLYCHMLGSSPELAPRHNPTPISAPQPRRPIRLLRLSVVSSLRGAMRPPNQATEVAEHVVPSTMTPQPRLMFTDPTTPYSSHIPSALEPTHEPELSHGRVLSFSPSFSHFQQQQVGVGGPPPLSSWPHADIVLNPPPKQMTARKRYPLRHLMITC